MGENSGTNGWCERVLALDWLRAGALVLNLALVAFIVYVLLWIPLQKRLIMSGQDQFYWNVTALLATVWITYVLAKLGARREVLHEARATARSAVNRILQARTGTEAILSNLDDKLTKIGGESPSGGAKLGRDAVCLHLDDMRHQVVLVSDTLRYAVRDWREILRGDWDKQSQGESEIAAVLQKAGELEAQIAGVQAEIAEKTEALEKERGEKAQIADDRRKLEGQVAELRRKLSEERAKAMAATQRVPFPVGTGVGTAAEIGSGVSVFSGAGAAGLLYAPP